MSRIPLNFLPGILRNIGIAWRLMQNPAVSPWIKLLLPLLAVVYYFSPIDLLPGLPFDDLFVVLFVFPKLMIHFAPPDAVEAAAHGYTQSPPPEEEDDQTIDVPWRSVS